jgi:hypothetical protein
VVVLSPQLAGEVDVLWFEVLPVLAVAAPRGGEQRADDGRLVQRAALLAVELGEALEGEVAALAKQVLGLGDDVAGLGAEFWLDVRGRGDAR